MEKNETTVIKPSFSFPKERRLREKRAFDRIFKTGKFVRGRHAYMVFEIEGVTAWQVAVVARKKDFRLATARNLVKRRLREVIRLSQAHYLPFRGVVVAKKGLPELPFQKLQGEWEKLIREAGLWSDEPVSPPAAPVLSPAAFLARLLLLGYKKFISPVLPRCCRFTPSCSTYALTAVEKYGFLKGGLLAVKRILRCHPFNPGGYDPVP